MLLFFYAVRIKINQNEMMSRKELLSERDILFISIEYKKTL